MKHNTSSNFQKFGEDGRIQAKRGDISKNFVAI